jgi:xanthine/uracil permease
LAGFEQGVNLIVETPFIIAAVIGVFLNLVLPDDKSEMDMMLRDANGRPIFSGEHYD